MKRFYCEPDFELVNITLLSDVLYTSNEPPTEETVWVGGEDFEDFFD